MFQGSTDDEYKSLMTFKTYCAEFPYEAEKGIKVVRLIWLPNKFPSITLETDRFRLRVSDRMEFYPLLIQEVEKWIEEDAVIGIRIASAERRSYAIDLLPGERAVWYPVGTYGLRAEIQNKPSKEKKRARLNPSSLNDSKHVEDPELGLYKAQEGASEA